MFLSHYATFLITSCSHNFEDYVRSLLYLVLRCKRDKAEHTPAIYPPSEYLQIQQSSMLHTRPFEGACLLHYYLKLINNNSKITKN